jgi:hypothetical protein
MPDERDRHAGISVGEAIERVLRVTDRRAQLAVPAANRVAQPRNRDAMGTPGALNAVGERAHPHDGEVARTYR